MKNLRLSLALIMVLVTSSVSAQQTPTEIVASVKSSKDQGFQTMLKDSVAIKKELGADKYYTRLHKLIFRGDIEPMFAESKSWEEIDKALQAKYGAVGEEAYLLTRMRISYEMKQWAEFKPLAKTLLQKYGSHLSEGDRKKYQEGLNAIK